MKPKNSTGVFNYLKHQGKKKKVVNSNKAQITEQKLFK